MTTPLCNCPDDVGWVSEGSWIWGDKSKAERIWCVNGVPTVRQYPQFAYGGDASITIPGTVLPLDQVGSAGAPVILQGPGATIQNYTYTNNTSAPMAFMLNCTMDLGLVLKFPYILYLGPFVRATGGGLHGEWNPMPYFNGGEIGEYGAFRQYTFTVPIPGRLQPGQSFTISQNILYFYGYYGSFGGTSTPGEPFRNGGVTPPIGDNSVRSLSLVSRIWGGNVNP